jgi:hypothetical protein
MDIKINIDDYIIRKVGISSIIKKIQRTVDLEKIRLLADEFAEELETEDIDSEKLMKSARKEAWAEYKEKYLKGLIPLEREYSLCWTY